MSFSRPTNDKEVIVPLMYLMIGAPGSGKSFIARLISECENALYVCPDLLRQANMGYSNSRVLTLAYEQMSEALHRQQSVIFDSTAAYNSHHREQVSRFARRHGACLIGVYVDTPYDLCVERHRQRIPLASQATLTPAIIRHHWCELQYNPPGVKRCEQYRQLVRITPSDDPISLLDLIPPV